MKNGDKVIGGTVTDLDEFGYDVVSDNGTTVMHVTTGDVRCDLGICDHEEHQYRR